MAPPVKLDLLATTAKKMYTLTDYEFSIAFMNVFSNTYHIEFDYGEYGEYKEFKNSRLPPP